MLSVIIPAHNESSVIERCLKSLLDGLQDTEVDIIVVCNGCKDNTAEIARSFKRVKVVELEEASKVLALNRGDEIAIGFPRAYIDADVELNGGDLLVAINHFQEPGVEVVSPKLHVDLSRSSALVKSFYSIWMKLPYFSDAQMVGSGVFILSENGRKRFEKFPQVIADDGYVRGHFDKNERLSAYDCKFKIFAPKTISDLIKIKSRSRFGNMELNQKFPDLRIGGENTAGSLFKLLFNSPQLVGKALVYCYVQWKTKKNAQKRFADSDFLKWERDESSREV